MDLPLLQRLKLRESVHLSSLPTGQARGMNTAYMALPLIWVGAQLMSAGFRLRSRA